MSFFSMMRRPPRATRFPDTTLVRSSTTMLHDTSIGLMGNSSTNSMEMRAVAETQALKHVLKGRLAATSCCQRKWGRMKTLLNNHHQARYIHLFHWKLFHKLNGNPSS